MPAKAIKPIKPSPMSDEAVEKKIRAFCAKDDAAGCVEFLKSRQIKAWHEVNRSVRPLEYAIEADAAKVFDALLDADKPEKGAGLKTRFWGGIKPIHAAALYNPSEKGGSSAPKCVAAILRRDPMSSFFADEEGRTGLDWAAMSPGKEAFELLAQAAIKAGEDGRASAKQVKAAFSSAAFYAVCDAPDTELCMSRIGWLERVGLDWRELADKEGQSLLGACLASSNGGRRAAEHGVALLLAGASPLSPMVEDDAKTEGGKRPKAVSCLQGALAPFKMRWRFFPKLFKALMSAATDEQFLEAMRAERNAPGGASLLRALMADSQTGSEALERFDRLEALEEARAIGLAARPGAKSARKARV